MGWSFDPPAVGRRFRTRPAVPRNTYRNGHGPLSTALARFYPRADYYYYPTANVQRSAPLLHHKVRKTRDAKPKPTGSPPREWKPSLARQAQLVNEFNEEL